MYILCKRVLWELKKFNQAEGYLSMGLEYLKEIREADSMLSRSIQKTLDDIRKEGLT